MKNNYLPIERRIKYIQKLKEIDIIFCNMYCKVEGNDIETLEDFTNEIDKIINLISNEFSLTTDDIRFYMFCIIVKFGEIQLAFAHK